MHKQGGVVNTIITMSKRMGMGIKNGFDEILVSYSALITEQQ